MATYSRSDWGALPSIGRFPWPSGQPSSYTFHYEGTTGIPANYTNLQYTQIVQAIQRYHLDHGYSDVAYNWLVSPRGDIYEGVGWGYHSQAQADPGNAQSVAICYVGGEDTPFTDAAKAAFTWLVNTKPLPVHPHSFWLPTSCPGSEILAWINAGLPNEDDLLTPEEHDALFAPTTGMRDYVTNFMPKALDKLKNDVAALVARPPTVSAAVDLDALAAKVVDLLAKRIST